MSHRYIASSLFHFSPFPPLGTVELWMCLKLVVNNVIGVPIIAEFNLWESDMKHIKKVLIDLCQCIALHPDWQKKQKFHLIIIIISYNYNYLYWHFGHLVLHVFTIVILKNSIVFWIQRPFRKIQYTLYHFSECNLVNSTNCINHKILIHLLIQALHNGSERIKVWWRNIATMWWKWFHMCSTVPVQ